MILSTLIIATTLYSVYFAIFVDDESWNLITCFCGHPFTGHPMIECSQCLTFKNGSMIGRYVYNDWMYGYIIG